MKQPQIQLRLQPLRREKVRQMLWGLGALLLLALAVYGAVTLYTHRNTLLAGAHAEQAGFRGMLEHMEAAHPELGSPEISSDALLWFTRQVPLQSRNPHEESMAIFVLERSSELTAYPCSSCHMQPLDELRAQSAQEGQLAHWNIELQHAAPETMTCSTCHNLEQMDELHTLTGASVSFDASYQTCSQCHASEYQDWLGGAHGKQIGGWAEPRVISSCTDCHNPHQPAWDLRWPALPPQQLQR
jgi:hypothetical protein